MTTTKTTTTKSCARWKFVLSSKSNTVLVSKSWYHDNRETFSVCHGREVKCACSFIIQITVSRTNKFVPCYQIWGRRAYPVPAITRHHTLLFTVSFSFKLCLSLSLSFSVFFFSSFAACFRSSSNLPHANEHSTHHANGIHTSLISWNDASQIRHENQAPKKKCCEMSKNAFWKTILLNSHHFSSRKLGYITIWKKKLLLSTLWIHCCKLRDPLFNTSLFIQEIFFSFEKQRLVCVYEKRWSYESDLLKGE